MISPAQAALLGIVEGLTEFLPVSSTGHLILAARCLRLDGDAVKTFEVIVQAGALAAVLGLYWARVASMWRGVLGHDAAGRRLFRNVVISFLPSAAAGVGLHQLITQRLFGFWPVIVALALGGALMIGVDRWLAERDGAPSRTLSSMTSRDALFIGLAQCASLWPGTSRAMVTIVTALLLGMPLTVAAEYSFLLALPMLGAATLLESVSGGRVLLQETGAVAVGCGLVTAAVVATLAMRGFLRYVTRRGLAPFGWYRIGIAGALSWMALRS